MPHLRLCLFPDHPAGSAIVLDRLARELAECESVEPSSVKAYAFVPDCFVPGPGHPPHFAHLEVKLLTGRSLALREMIADRLYAALRDQLLGRGITVEVTEMERATYRKG